MRVCIIGNYPINNQCVCGGVEASVYGLVKELSQEHDVYVVDLPRIKGEDCLELDGQIHVRRFVNSRGMNYYALFRCLDIIHWIEEIKPELCHIHGTSAIARKLYFGLSRRGVPVILTVHGLVHVEKLNALYNGFSLRLWLQLLYQSRIEFDLLSKSDRIVVDTEYVKVAIEKCHQQGKISRLPSIDVVPQGVDNVYFNHCRSHASKMVLSVGAFTKRKGHHKLLEAFELIAENDKDTQLVIAGALTDHDFFEVMTNRVRQSKFVERIRLLPNVDKSDLLDLFGEAKLFALYTEEESQGIVFAEAMAMGLPIVSTLVGGVPCVVQNGINGLLCDYANIQEFSNSLQLLLSDEIIWRKMSIRSLELSIEYRWNDISHRIASIYSDCKRSC